MFAYHPQQMALCPTNIQHIATGWSKLLDQVGYFIKDVPPHFPEVTLILVCAFEMLFDGAVLDSRICVKQVTALAFIETYEVAIVDKLPNLLVIGAMAIRALM